MSKDLNKWTGIGRLGQDPEIRYTAGGVAVINCTMATTDKWKDQEHTEWNRLVVWDKLAEIMQRYCHKGDKLYIEGGLRTRNYEKDNVRRYVTEIRVIDMIMLGSPGDRSSQEHTGAPSQQSAPAPASSSPPDDGFDDIPF